MTRAEIVKRVVESVPAARRFTCPQCKGTGRDSFDPGTCTGCRGRAYVERPLSTRERAEWIDAELRRLGLPPRDARVVRRRINATSANHFGRLEHRP